MGARPCFATVAQIGVRPGYAVDCCGNDITITSDYKVNTYSLVQDPAAAAELSEKGPHRMHLLLEYFECTGGPQPLSVHGDVCSSETTHCEMGRIRETARLGLCSTKGSRYQRTDRGFAEIDSQPGRERRRSHGTRLGVGDTSKSEQTHRSICMSTSPKDCNMSFGPQLDFQLQPFEGRRLTG